MSYILDALKKSEAERSRGVVPTLLTPTQTPFRSGAVAWVLVAVLIVNAALLIGWLYRPNTPERAPEAATSAATPTIAPTTAPAGATATAPETVRASDYPPVAASLPAASPPATQIPAPAATAQDDTRGGADVSFSTHVYATDPSMRAVTMNGKRFVEGDMIRPGVRIREITETGVVLDVNGRPIPVDVLQDWR